MEGDRREEGAGIAHDLGYGLQLASSWRRTHPRGGGTLRRASLEQLEAHREMTLQMGTDVGPGMRVQIPGYGMLERSSSDGCSGWWTERSAR